MPILTPKSLGALIAYAIKTKNVSYYQIKDNTGLEQRQVQNMESDTGGASMASYLKLFAYLGVNMDLSFNQKTLTTTEKRKVRRSAKEQFVSLSNDALPFQGLASTTTIDCDHPDDKLVCPPGKKPFCTKCQQEL